MVTILEYAMFHNMVLILKYRKRIEIKDHISLSKEYSIPVVLLNKRPVKCIRGEVETFSTTSLLLPVYMQAPTLSMPCILASLLHLHSIEYDIGFPVFVVRVHFRQFVRMELNQLGGIFCSFCVHGESIILP